MILLHVIGNIPLCHNSPKEFEEDRRNIFWNFLLTGDNFEIMDRVRMFSKRAVAHENFFKKKTTTTQD